MPADREILATIYEAVREFNIQLPPETRLVCEPGTIVAGEGGSIDSLGMVSLIVLVEESLSSRLGLSVPLLQDAYVTDANGPLRTLGSIAEHVAAHAAD